MDSRTTYRISRMLPLAAFFIFALGACSRNKVNLMHFSPEGEVPALTTFTLDFDTDLAPADMQGQWLTDSFLKFEPHINGKYRWDGANRLLFSPAEPLRPSQDYKAWITDRIYFGKAELKSSFDPLSFHTPYFKAEAMDIHWMQIPHTQFKVKAEATLKFNYPVDPKVLPDFIKVEQDGEEVKNFAITTQTVTDQIVLDLGEQQQTEQDKVFRVIIAEGLAPAASGKAIETSADFGFTLPPLTELAITGVTAGLEEEKGWIEVVTTQPVDHAQAMKFISLDPAIPVKAEPRGNALRLVGELPAGAAVKVSVRKGMPGLYGGKLEADHSEEVFLADLEPELKFASKNGKYLMRGGNENVEVKAVNIPAAEVNLYQIYENNILYFLYNQGKRYYGDNCCGASAYHVMNTGEEEGEGDSYEDEYYYDDYYYDYGGSPEDYGSLIHTDTLTFPERRNLLQSAQVNLSKHLNGRFRGVFLIQLQDREDYWRRSNKVVAVSDLGIIAKRSRNELTVFVNSISGAVPVAGAEVRLISSNNQTLITGTTNSEGVVQFKDTRKQINDFTPRLLTVSMGQDFNFMDLAETELELSRYDVGGKPEYHEDYETYLYAERNLYRPGEVAHFNAILRTKELQRAGNTPLIFKVTSPRGRVVAEHRRPTDEEGAAEFELTLPVQSETGQYHLSLMGGDNSLLAEYTFSVEEFQPDKIRVEAEGDKKILNAGEALHLNIFSEYLFGTPCAEHDYEVDLNFTQSHFSSKKFSGYTFYRHGVSNSSFDNQLVQGKLDADGKAVEELLMPASFQTTGKVQGRAFVSVFDATGKTVNRSVPFEVYNNDAYIGIQSKGWYKRLGEKSRVDLVAVGPDDKAVKNVPVTVKLIRKEWRTVVESRDGNYRYRSVYKEFEERVDHLVLSSLPSQYNFVVTKAGDYEVRVYRKGEDAWVSAQFYAYGDAGSTATSFEVDREGRVEITADKETYQPGDKARLLFTTPFSGRMLITVEQNRILHHTYVDVVNHAAELELKITEDMLPNCFVSATIFRPHKDLNGIPFFVGHGYQPLRVEKPSNRLNVEIVAPEKVKPRRTQEITLKTGGDENVFVTLAVVDEGILQIKNYQSPDPYAWMYASRKLGVSQYDLYEMLLEETGSSAPAGSDDAGARLNPISAQRFKLLSYWSGIRRANSSGEVHLNVNLPHFNGAARIMAVAWSGARFGAASKTMTIADDVVMLPALPRFLAPGDSVLMPVSFMNTTQKAGALKVTVKTEGPVKVLRGAQQTLNMKAKDNQSLDLAVKVEGAPGLAKIILETEGLDAVKDVVEIPVRPTMPYSLTGEGGSIKAGTTQNLRISSDYVKGTQKNTLFISRMPLALMGKQIQDLLGYPHGCLEQTISKAFPQMYFEDIAREAAPDVFLTSSPVQNVKEGIRKVQSMQNYDGSFSYWYGENTHYDWASVYAAHFLTEARKAGYDVSLTVLEKARNYLNRHVLTKDEIDYDVWNGSAWVSEKRANPTTLYALYVLSLAGKPDLSLMNYYRARPGLLTGDSRYMLAGAFGLQNDWAAFRQLLPPTYGIIRARRQSSHQFDSEIRANALVLNVLMDVDPGNAQVPQIVQYLSKNVRSAWSTQENAWLFLGLGKAARKMAQANVTVEVQQSGKTVATFRGDNLTLRGDQITPGNYTLKATGSGMVYYSWSTRGIPLYESAVPQEDHDLQVRRTFLNRSGQEVKNATFQQGDLVVCRITLATAARGVENIAISDLIPAGFEVENPRLGTSTQLPWVKNQGSVQYMDVRDDRVLYYASLGAQNVLTVHYMLRAANAGRFKLAPLGAESMYDPDYWSRNGGGWVTVLPR